MISHQYRFIHFHIPRTAGSSVQDCLWGGRSAENNNTGMHPRDSPDFYGEYDWHLDGFNTDKVNKRDYMYKNIPIEAKITLSDGDSWTGNGTKKTPWHLLFKFKINDDGIIEGCFCMFANICECITDWSEPKKSKKGLPVNFSGISFKNKNHTNNKLHVVSGDLHCVPKKVIVKEMKKFANDNNIPLGKLKKKADILNHINEKLKGLDSSINEKWNKLSNNPEGKIEYIY